jgi:GNAT superfamily N-acetyltransferase
MLDGDELIGWALVLGEERYEWGWHGFGSNFAMFYVKKRYRRQGVGTQLADWIRKDHDFVTIDYSYRSEEFFLSVGLLEPELTTR